MCLNKRNFIAKKAATKQFIDISICTELRGKSVEKNNNNQQQQQQQHIEKTGRKDLREKYKMEEI